MKRFSPLAHLDDRLAGLEAAGQRRTPRNGRPDALCLCSNDYLGYASGPDETLSGRVGATASRLIAGTFDAHVALEAACAELVGQEAALVFSSGYAANVGLLQSVAEAGDTIFSDALNHASIIDGCRLARADVVVYPHLDLDALERALAARRGAGRAWIVTESYFSMDGDVADLAATRAIADAHGAALLVDEAHALGVLGPHGRGVLPRANVRADAVIGTFGKSFGGQGAFVAGEKRLVDWLYNRARSFVFSTGLAPIVAAANERSVRRALADDAGRARLVALGDRLRTALRDLGYDVPRASVGPIVPVMIGDDRRAVAISDALLARGVWVNAIRPPTVPRGTARLRVTVHPGLTDADLDRAIAAFSAVKS